MMRFLLTIFVFIFIINFSNAQEVCMQLDSIECYRIPWRLQPDINIYKDEIIHEEPFSLWRVKNTVKDEEGLQYFVDIDFVDTTKILSLNKSVDDIDARAVIILYYNRGVQDTIVLNGRLSYHYGSKVYLSNIKLLLWLIEYNPLTDPNNEFIKGEYISRLREEYNFMNK